MKTFQMVGADPETGEFGGKVRENLVNKIVTLAVPMTPLDGLVPDSSAAATANTTAVQAALDDPFYRVVHLPDRLFYVNALSIPANKHLTGEYSRAYTTAPTSGTRLRAATAAQTAAVITMNGRSKLTNIAVLGAGSGAAHPGVRIASNGAVLRDCAIGFANSGVEADYKLAILENVHIFSNTFDGIRNILDGKVIGCTINANGRRGIYAGTGANCTQYVGNRIEWNLGRGVDIYQANLINLVSNIIDRNGGAGLAAVQSDRVTVVGNDFWRNGAQSQGVAADDCNIFLQQNVNEKIVANGTKTGENDGGGGYNSPLVAVRSQANTGGLVTANDFAGGTATGWQTVSADTGVKRHSNLLRTGESETFIGASYTAEVPASGIAAGATATLVLALPVIGTNSTGRVVRVAVSARDHASSAPFAASFDLFISRALSGDATVTVGPLTNIAGTAFSLTSGTHVVTATVSADGATLTLTITNGASGTRSFVARAN